MPLDKPHPRARRCGIELEEEQAWIGFYRRVGRDAAIAAEVMAQLEADADMKRTHLALYLCCKESLRVHKARQARNKRIGQFARHLAQAIFVRPLLGLRTRPRPSPPDPQQLRRLAVRRRSVGRRSQARPFRFHHQDARPRD